MEFAQPTKEDDQIMIDNVYRKLAQRLDTIPNGFPPTESGIELRLLEKIFTLEEAALASVMRLTPEPAADIAARASADPKVTSRTLKQMARKGQIHVRVGEERLLFGLMPFVVGIYEEQLPRMDAELAELFEQYYYETQGGGFVRTTPAVQRVIPVGEAIPVDVEVFPYEHAVQLIESAKSWGVRDCICRVQQKLIGKGCDRPIEVCLVFAPVEGAFRGEGPDRPITKEEALHILRQTEEAGLIHSTGNYKDGNSYICNCCTCCCGIMRSVVEFGIPTAVVSSDFHAVVDADECIGCGECVQQCPFKALAVPEQAPPASSGQVCEVDVARCVGCGQCTTVCSTSAIYLERRPKDEVPPLPANRREWLAKRAEARGIDLQDIL
jgi:electron transport complex protein RnfB